MKIKKIIALFLSLALCLSLFAACSAGEEESSQAPADSSKEESSASESSSQEAMEEGQSAESMGVPPALGLAYGANTPLALSEYAIHAAAPKDGNMVAVVAVDKDNNPILTNAQLQFYFWEELYQMQEYYGDYYLSMFGLSVGKPLWEQSSLDEKYTWEQYFVEASYTTFSNLYAMAAAAKAEGYTLDEESRKNLDYYTTEEGGFLEDIAESGYETMEDYLLAFYGPGVDLQDYRAYLENYFLATEYYNDVLFTPVYEAQTDADVDAYYAENQEQFENSGMIKVNNVSVRHILIQPTETDEATGEFTEASWKQAQAQAQDLYDLWLTNPTEEYFGQLATNHTADTGSVESGGLYEDFAPGQMVQEFNDWSFDQSREAGDHAIVKTDYGYHIMYFVEQTETRTWYETVKSEIAGTAANAAMEELKKTYPVNFDYTQVRIFDIVTYVIEKTQEESAETVTE